MCISYQKLRYDAVIIGNGLSGHMAAYHLDPQHSVAVLSAGSGASPHVIGFNIPLHRDDSVDLFIQDTMKGGSYQSDPQLVEALCGDSLMMKDVLAGFGFELDRDGDEFTLRQPLGASFPRVAGRSNITGMAIMEKLDQQLSARGNRKEYTPVRALRLLVKQGAVKGVLAYDLRQKAMLLFETDTVILACGGYCGIYPFSTNTPDMGGDVLGLAYYAGVPLADLEFVQFEPTAAVSPPEIRGLGVSTTMCPEGAVIRNVDGERFMLNATPIGELVNKDVMSKIIYEEIQRGKGTPGGGVWLDATAVGAERLHKAYDLFIQRYGRFGIDITKSYMEVAPAAHTSLGGVRIDTSCATELAGLFACGETVGSIHGGNRLGGNAGLETLVFGRRAGLAADAYLKGGMRPSAVSDQDWHALLRPLQCGDAAMEEAQAKYMEYRIREQVGQALNVIREEASMQRAAAVFQHDLEKVGQWRAEGDAGLYEKLRMQNNLTAAALVTLSAMERKETLGCHIRSDSQPEAAPYRVVIRQGDDGPVMHREAMDACKRSAI